MKSDKVEPASPNPKELDDDHVVWAAVEAEGSITHIILQTVRLPRSIAVQSVGDRIEGHARRILRASAYDDAIVDGAVIFIAPLPSQHDVKSLLDQHLANGDAVVSVDLACWETCRRWLLLKARAGDNKAETEMDFCGLRIRQAPFAKQPPQRSIRLTV